MKPYRKTAVLVGLLFPVATIAFYAATALVLGILDVPDSSARATAETNAPTTGALLFFVDALAVVSIGFLMYPLLKRYSERLALSYLGLRIGEFAAVLVVMSAPLLLVPLSLASPAELAIPTGGVEFSDHLLVVARRQYEAAMALVFLCTATSGIILAFVLTRSKLDIRPVAVLGAIGYLAMLLGTVLEMYEVLDLQHGAGLFLVLPVGLFENLALPIWLFIRGFNTESMAERLQERSDGSTVLVRDGYSTR